MQFANPSFLWALFLVVIPIIVHLFDFRRYRKQVFSDTFFLKLAIEKNKKYSHLRQWIIMSLRILAIAALVLAFAEPFIPNDSTKTANNTGQNMICIYLDNSLSMEVNSTDMSLFETARKKAIEIANAYSQNTLFRLITNDFDGANDRYMPKDEFLQSLNSVNISPHFRTLSDISKRIKDIASQYPNASHNIFIISDFQKSSANLTEADFGNSNIYLIPLASQTQTNIGIDSVWIEEPIILKNSVIAINAKIRNYSDILIEKIPVRLFVNDKQKGLSDIQIAAGGSQIVTFNFTVNDNNIAHHGYFEIDDSPILFDDKMYFAFTISSQIPVVHITGQKSGNTIAAIFDKDSLFTYNHFSENDIDFNKVSSSDFIILDELNNMQEALSNSLLSKINEGATVLFIPSEKYSPKTFDNFFKNISPQAVGNLDTSDTKVNELDYNHPLFKDVFETVPLDIKLPRIKSSYRLPSNQGRWLMKMSNNNNFLTEYKYGKGNLYILAVPLEDNFSDFQSNALIVPTFMKMAFANHNTQTISYPIDYSEGISIQNKEQNADLPPHLQSFDSKIDIIPSFSNGLPPMIYLMGQISKTGPYKIVNNNETLAAFALNNNNKESFPEIYTIDDLQKISENSDQISLFDNNTNISTFLAETQYGKRLWKTFLIFALIFLGLEVILLRIWKSV